MGCNCNKKNKKQVNQKNRKTRESVRNSRKVRGKGSLYVKERKDICRECEKSEPSRGYLKCSECGCLVTLRIMDEGSSCPLDKW